MKENNQWLLMTYYCPTHGSEDISEPIQLSKDDLKRAKNNFSEKEIGLN